MLMDMNNLKQINQIQQLTKDTVEALTEPIQPIYLMLKPEQYNLLAENISTIGNAIVRNTDLISELPTQEGLEEILTNEVRYRMVQYLKYKVLREVARLAWNDTLLENLFEIPKTIVPGNTPTMRCCVYKERAILSERVKIAIGSNPNIIEVIDIACDECPMGGYEVTNACRGCLAHRCEDVCRFGALSFDREHVAHIDKTKCKECGACSRVCPYTAIINRKRPCEMACKIKAISMNENKAAAINYDKCISCGACVYQCPFGAITDKSYMLDVIDIINKNS